MISELSSRQKYIIVIVGILVSLIMHIAILDVRFHTRTWIKSLITQSTPLFTQPISTQRPITMTTQVPHPPRMAQALPRTTVQALPVPPAPAPITQPTPEPPTTTHRIYRAGTGFDAPQTDHPIATMGGKKPTTTSRSVEQQHTPASHPLAQPTAQTQQSTYPTTASVQPDQIRVAQATTSFNPNRLPIVIHEKGTRTPITRAEQLSHPAAPPAATTQSGAFTFLSQNNFNQAIQTDVTDESENTDITGSTGNGIGSFGSRYGAREQYGDPRFLHYNSRVYHALQQSMDIAIGKLTQKQYYLLLDGAHTPTRIRFALDRDGTIQQITITRSSGSQRYDAMAQHIVHEASFPPIPASFNMHTTYHQYGIIFYNDGALNEHVGVSPYLEGE